MTTRDEWRSDLDQLAAALGRTLQPWQLDVAAEVFVSRLPERSPTGAADIWVAAQLAGQRVVEDMRADGRLNEWGNWPHAD